MIALTRPDGTTFQVDQSQIAQVVARPGGATVLMASGERYEVRDSPGQVNMARRAAGAPVPGMLTR